VNLAALQHLLRSAQALAEDCEIIVLGSASLLASFPFLGDDAGPLASTYDADLCPSPFDETTAVMLSQALGESQAFHLRHGYHADILRPAIFETLPSGWRDRVVRVPGCDFASALEPNDLAVVKMLVARGKDINLVRVLNGVGFLDGKVVADRLRQMELDEKLIRRSSAAWQQAFVDREA
jgi:hypothetical protein